MPSYFQRYLKAENNFAILNRKCFWFFIEMDDQPSPTFIEDAKSVGRKGRGGGRGRSPGKQRATPTPGTRRSSRLHHDDVTTPDELMSDDDKHLVTTFFVASVVFTFFKKFFDIMAESLDSIIHSTV
jgi:hypothetical protein